MMVAPHTDCVSGFLGGTPRRLVEGRAKAKMESHQGMSAAWGPIGAALGRTIRAGKTHWNHFLQFAFFTGARATLFIQVSEKREMNG